MPATKAKKVPAKKAAAKVFSDAEMEAMQAAKKERKKGGKADGLADLKAAIDKLSGLDRTIADGLHALVSEHAPSLAPKTWYGLPAWANADGKAVIFLTPATKFKARYANVRRRAIHLSRAEKAALFVFKRRGASTGPHHHLEAQLPQYRGDTGGGACLCRRPAVTERGGG